ncbi:cadherin-like and PC-esterase domain-containing protein 1 [Cloeon dipterum]|uniref:cadherin-like and PC-esterase domain-containing protein 1 n=1 Tax=Cloeon dipterum TaxID=197152 RepID=UPI00321FEED7
MRRGSSMEVLLAVCGVSVVSVLVTYQWVASPLSAPAHPQAPSAVFIPSHLHHILHSLESQQLGVESKRMVAKMQGSYQSRAELYASLFDINYHVNTTSQEWSLLLCGPHLCSFGRLSDGQKVSQIPGMSSLLSSKAALCRLQRQLAEAALGALLCFSLPEDFEDLLNVADSTDNQSIWTIEPSGPARPVQTVNTYQLFEAARLKKFPERGIVKTVSKRYLLMNGQYAIHAHFAVLVTSMAPLRAYLDERDARIELLSSTTQHQNSWNVQRLWSYLGPEKSVRVRNRIRNFVLFFLLKAEIALSRYLPSSNRQNFFQLISIQISLDEELSPIIESVEPDPRVERRTLSKLFRLVTSADSVHDELTRALLYSGAGCDSQKCPPSKEDFLYLLSTRRETLHAVDLVRLYPQPLPLPQKWVDKLVNETGKHVTIAGESLYSTVEKYFASKTDLTDNNNLPQYKNSNLESLHVLPGRYLEPSKDESLDMNLDCSSNSENTMYLRYLSVDRGMLQPLFDPEVRQYEIKVAYNTTLVQVRAAPVDCNVLVFFDDQNQPTKLYKSSVGLGENKLVIRLLSSKQQQLNTYWVTIIRHPEKPDSPFNPDNEHQVCSLKQDCKFKFSPSEQCGLHVETGRLNWPLTVDRFSKLAICSSGDSAGRWVLPCRDCRNRTSCWWEQARWQPFECQHPKVQLPQKCLENKKVLFMGDSTVRGMMHHVLERLNGSLGVKDKSHGLSHFKVANTALAFAYYPQFWLRPPHRPIFAKTLYQLLLSSQPLSNSSDTILVVGGVHWLATNHLHTLIKILKREGLEGAKIVVKTLGSGFHIPADGVHLLSTRQQEKLVLHSQGLAAFGKHFNMEVVETFNITAARFRDFLPGKCACHFHNVNASGREGVFHVEGAVNAIYSEILLARMCS